MVEAAPLPFREAPRHRPSRFLPLLSLGLLACAAVLAAVHQSSRTGPVELDRRESEIQKLQQEKQLLEAQLSNQRQPLIHPATIKAAAHSKAHARAQIESPHAKKKAQVTDLMSEKKALEQQLATAAKDSAGDPMVEGVLGTFKAKSGDGLLGHLRDTTDNVMGSLAATMTSAQKLKMLTNEAKAMGDVSPKEALAQRVISIGKDLLKQKPSIHTALALPIAPQPAQPQHARAQQLHIMKAQAAARIATKHVAAHSEQKQTAMAHHPARKEDSVAAAKHRVALLKKELQQAQRVQRLEESLAHAKLNLHATESKMSTVAKGQQLVASLDGGNGRYAAATETAKKFLGLNEEHEEEEEEAHEEAEHAAEEEAEKKAEDCRFKGDCHAKGYVSGGIVVGTAEHTGPDRYGQLGVGPQELHGKVGDNVVGAGLLGATGVYEDDVLVPTRLSGVRRRDVYRRNENPHTFKNLDAETRNELVEGSVMHHFGSRGKLGIADERVPIKGMSAEEFRDKARMEQLASH